MLLKRTNKHTIYEVWCEWAADSVFVDHKPSKAEMEELRKKNWPGTDQWGIIHKLKVFKLANLYTTAPTIVKRTKPDPNRCPYCNGSGPCPGCGGTGRKDNKNEVY